MMSGLLDKINLPSDLKAFTYEELEQLATEIRAKLVDTVSKNGGHLASNLGVVELTLALHYVFNAPKDKIVWDVGHQCYVHKILTGRKQAFETIRTYGGISGFPKRHESEYDTFGVGHASTGVSAALGMARARDLEGEDYAVVAVLGDGALTGGMCYEALNDAGNAEKKLIVVLNDNGMSIAHNVGAMNGYLSKLRSSPEYNKFKSKTKHFLDHIPGIGKWLSKQVERFKNKIKYFLIPGVLFEELGFTYLGPIDGHDIQKLVLVLRQAEKLDRPVIIHIKTTKGKGYEFAENNPEKFHGIAPFYVETGDERNLHRYSNSACVGQVLCELAQNDPSIVAVTAAMPQGTGLMAFCHQYPERFFDVGIAEQHAVTMAAGMAANGMRPVVAIYSSFFQRAYDQILHDVCLQNLPMVLAVDRAGLVGEDGETHHGAFDVAYLRHMPNISIFSPASLAELGPMLKMAIKRNGPCAIRYPREKLIDDIEGASEVIYGKWDIVAPIQELTIIATGRMVGIAISILPKLIQQKINAGLVNARFIKPLDDEMLSSIYRKAKWVYVLEDGATSGGFGSAVLEHLHAHKRERYPNVALIGIPDEFIPHGPQSALYASINMTGTHIYERIMKDIQGGRNDEQ